MRTIAVFLPNWIGDVVMATPVLRSLAERFPDARILAICKPYVAAVLDGARWIHEVIPFDKNGPRSQRCWSVGKRLRREHVDAAVLLPNSFRTALVAWLGGCRRRIGYARYLRDRLLTDRFEPLRDRQGNYLPTPIIRDYLRLLEPLGIRDASLRLELFTTPTDEAAAEAVWEKFGLHRFETIVGLNTGGAFGAAKVWPSDYFAHLARRLTRERNAAVLILCGPSERDAARTIARAAGVPNVFTLADEPVSIGLTKACVKRVSILVTTDSGPRHFAAAFDRPVVTLFGPTHIEWTETFHPRALHLQKKLPCGPCQQRICPQGHHRCMKELLPDEVYAATVELLQADRRTSGREDHA